MRVFICDDNPSIISQLEQSILNFHNTNKMEPPEIISYNTVVKKILVETKDGYYTVSSDDIICVETDERHVAVHTGETTYISTQHISYFKSILDGNNFTCSHKGVIVNMDYISHFDKNRIYFKSGSLTAYISRRRFNEFKDTYTTYLSYIK